jgi:hypothetical protein
LDKNIQENIEEEDHENDDKEKVNNKKKRDRWNKNPTDSD